MRICRRWVFVWFRWSQHVSLGGEEDALSFEGFVGDGPDGRLYWILGEEGDSASFKLYRVRLSRGKGCCLQRAWL